MKNISLNIDKALGTVTKEQVYAQAAKAHECNATLQNGNGAGNDFLGWLHLPSSITDAELTDIENTANVLRSKCEVIVAIGIGGSYPHAEKATGRRSRQRRSQTPYRRHHRRQKRRSPHAG